MFKNRLVMIFLVKKVRILTKLFVLDIIYWDLRRILYLAQKNISFYKKIFYSSLKRALFSLK